MRQFVYFFVFNFIQFLIVLVPFLVSVAYLTLAERKVLAAMQKRQGPVSVGFYGLMQPFADGIKLIFKESVIPLLSDKIVFILAPILMLFLSVSFLAVLPFNIFSVLVDINVAFLYLFSISAIEIYAILMAGWGSNSVYAFLGSLRSSAQMISYEVSIGLILLNFFLISESLNLSAIANFQSHYIWFFLPMFPLLILMFVSLLAETSRAPFDLPESESELVAGYNVEYSSNGFALFFIGEYLNIISSSVLFVLLFLGGVNESIFNNFGILMFNAKIIFVMFAFIWVRAAFPRYRYDQLMRLGWKVFLPFSIGFFVFVIGISYTFLA